MQITSIKQDYKQPFSLDRREKDLISLWNIRTCTAFLREFPHKLKIGLVFQNKNLKNIFFYKNEKKPWWYKYTSNRWYTQYYKNMRRITQIIFCTYVFRTWKNDNVKSYLINKLNIIEIDHFESNELLLCKAHDSQNIYLPIISTICKSLFLQTEHESMI